jgi:hypothetical protein
MCNFGIQNTVDENHDPGVAETLSTTHDKYVVVPTGKVPYNFVLICKKHCIICLKTPLGLGSAHCHSTYYTATITKRGNQ